MATHADASYLARADASRPGPRDASTRGRRDASTVVELDASHRTGADTSRPPCAWCRGRIPDAARCDAVCCSKSCRQARWRFGRTVGRAVAAAGMAPLRLAYADPPYPGRAHLYRGHPDYAGEVNHETLIGRLATYDGWALSTSAMALRAVLALCPAEVRVAAWHRGERAALSWEPLTAWEPVIYVPARPLDPAQGRRADSLVHGVAPMTTLPGRVTGTKPATFCRWVFELLGAAAGDTLDDLFPGSGIVGQAWATYTGGTRRASTAATHRPKADIARPSL